MSLTAADMLLLFLLPGVVASCSLDSDLFITAPKTLEALSGSCLHIPCRFHLKGEDQSFDENSTSSVWMKKDPGFIQKPENVVFNSSRDEDASRMRMTGNLSDGSCSTLFSSLLTTYSNKYFFRLERRTFKATAVCNPIQIKVKDSPARPRIEISGELTEDESVTVTCSALTPCPQAPPTLTWTLGQAPPTQLEENTDGTFRTRIQQSLTLSAQHDGQEVSCSAAYPVSGGGVKTAARTKTLSVSHAPRRTTVSVSASGGRVNLTCSSRATPPVSSFTWFLRSPDGDRRVSEGRVHSVNVTRRGVYYCVAANAVGQEASEEFHLSAEDVPDVRVVVFFALKIVAIAALCGTFAVLQWCFRRRRCVKVKDAADPVIQIQAP